MYAEKLPISFYENFHSTFKGDTYVDCFPCGGCEFTLLAPLFPGETDFIASKVNISEDKFYNTFVDVIQTPIFDIDSIRLTAPCPFLDSMFQCRIRDFKPILCEIYPLLITLKINGTHSTKIDSWCPLSQRNDIVDEFFLKWGKVEDLFNIVDPKWLRSLEYFDDYYYDFHKLQDIRGVPLEKVAMVPLKELLDCRIESIPAMESGALFMGRAK